MCECGAPPIRSLYGRRNVSLPVPLCTGGWILGVLRGMRARPYCYVLHLRLHASIWSDAKFKLKFELFCAFWTNEFALEFVRGCGGGRTFTWYPLQSGAPEECPVTIGLPQVSHGGRSRGVWWGSAGRSVGVCVRALFWACGCVAHTHFWCTSGTHGRALQDRCTSRQWHAAELKARCALAHRWGLPTTRTAPFPVVGSVW